MEWLRRKGIDAAHYRKEEWHHVFFEHWQDGWTGQETQPEREVVANPDLGISFVYRCYPVCAGETGTKIPTGGFDSRATAGQELLVRCFKFYHGKRQLGRPRKDDQE